MPEQKVSSPTPSLSSSDDDSQQSFYSAVDQAVSFPAWEEVSAEVTSHNPRWPAILAKLSSDDPLEYFPCTIGIVPFSAGETINMLADGSIYNKELIDRHRRYTAQVVFDNTTTFRSPTTNLVFSCSTQLYVYQDLMTYIKNPSDANLLKLCQDQKTGQIMENPRIITYVDNSGEVSTVCVRICDQRTVGNGNLTLGLKTEFFSSPNIPDQDIRNIAFDNLKHFINHPAISPRVLPLEQARLRLVSELERQEVELQRAEKEREMEKLQAIKLSYSKNRHSMFSPIRLFGMKSHAAKVEDARTVAEITALLWASYKQGGENASTKTINQQQLPKPAL